MKRNCNPSKINIATHTNTIFRAFYFSRISPFSVAHQQTALSFLRDYNDVVQSAHPEMSFFSILKLLHIAYSFGKVRLRFWEKYFILIPKHKMSFINIFQIVPIQHLPHHMHIILRKYLSRIQALPEMRGWGKASSDWRMGPASSTLHLLYINIRKTRLQPQ